jgi:hypothetical protein
MPLRFVVLTTYHVTIDPTASPAAVRIRRGIMTGAVSQ